MSKKDFSVALKYVEARPRSQRRKGAEARVSGISVVGSGASATDLSLLQANLISVTNNFTALKDLFDSMFEKDSEGNIHAKLSLWSSGGITAGGVGSGGSGGGGISYNRLDSWSDYSADKSGWVLSALLGKDLDNRVSALANAGYITASYLAPYALRSEIPSLVGYATQSWVGDNFLSKSGGTLTDALTVKGSGSPLTVHRTQPLASVVKFVNTDGNLGWLGVDIDKTAIFMEASGVINKLLHSGNYSDYALPKTGGIMAKNSYIDWGNTDGFEDYSAYSNGFKILGYNAGSDDYRGGIHVGVRYGWQLTRNAGSEVFQIRNYSPSSASWGDWKTIAFTSDIPTKLSQLTDDVVAGKYLSLAGGTVNGSITASSFIGKLTGNADSATKLATPRTIWGQSFDGTGNVGGDLYVHQLKIELGNEINSYTYNFNTANGNVHLNYHSSGHVTLANGGGNVAIGGTATEAKLHVYGNGKFTGALTSPAITTNSLTIGGATITYDSVNEALCVNGNMYALGGITAGGAGISAYTSLEARVARLEQQLNIS